MTKKISDRIRLKRAYEGLLVFRGPNALATTSQSPNGGFVLRLY
jgi:hypothetical protein